ncbi:benzaldehyde dehydrogenase [Galbitalea soli]|uniref:Benzaldehyde dehydrogenase n=1 Tax=Galbitalea soli TaxID=1268042 RepID=A0A7C9TR33_9MICO|nr:benzaldehyde dehydrogenase [Galbitalea soli]NEM91082.1 benzaldehyde dehydrogenase [Galbitalea soli]NYJ29770.1 benzaldehyde dehydrogenase (NAD) [Galbitalea soli]
MSLLEDPQWSGALYSGTWRRTAAATADVVEPATGALLGSVGVATREDVQRAATAAASAQKDWAKRSPEQRAAVLRKAGLLWEQHAEEIQGWIVRESGAILPKAQLETHTAANECFDASALPSLKQGDVLASNEARWSFARHLPVGVVSVIAPFNFPLILAIRSVAPALALGNAVLLKPDLRTTVSGGVSIVRIFEEAGLPEGLLHLLPGGVEVGEALVEAPEVRVVSFTGSTAAGRAVGALGARHLKRVHLELGGKNALIVLPGADLARATSAGAFGSFMHQGQICMATGRHLVHESMFNEYVDALASTARALPVGDPASAQVALGPIIDQRQLDRIDSVVRRTVEMGGIVAAGGTHQDLFYAPTVMTGLGAGMPAWQEEIFGPVAPVRSFANLDEATAIATDNEYGLSLGILGDVGMAMELADRIPSGKIHINEQTVSDESNAPFGGVGWSGNGSRIGGAETNLDAFTDVQWLTMRSTIAEYPF